MRSDPYRDLRDSLANPIPLGIFTLLFGAAMGAVVAGLVGALLTLRVAPEVAWPFTGGAWVLGVVNWFRSLDREGWFMARCPRKPTFMVATSGHFRLLREARDRVAAETRAIHETLPRSPDRWRKERLAEVAKRERDATLRRLKGEFRAARVRSERFERALWRLRRMRLRRVLRLARSARP